MTSSLFNDEDVKQIKAREIGLQNVISQVEAFKKGFPFISLQRPCTPGDGIKIIEKSDLGRLENIYSQAASYRRVMKFVPASGAASRMFKLLLSFNSRYDQVDEKHLSLEAEKGDPDHRAFLRFIGGIKKFAFYDDLRSAMAKGGLDIEGLISRGRYKDILEYILTQKGLNYADLPKGLIKFHLHPDRPRTPFEEHLVEAAAYTRDKNNIVRIHFTVPLEYEGMIKKHMEEVRGYYESSGVRYEITFSTQRSSTDTVAVGLDNKLFRDKSGRLVFRPSGHGALLDNLNDLGGDIVFIRNIDNVAPDRLKRETYIYKKALGGYLIELQRETFSYLERLSVGDVNEGLLAGIFEFARYNLSIVPPQSIGQGSKKEKESFLFSKLNRPIRVCGMVQNQGEPGGGPFWVRHGDGTLSLQIVESSQVDMESSPQRGIWESSTHFNPADLVCGVRDYLGDLFDLKGFTDPNTGFISVKSMDGKEIKALELPGLWNGGMANWNTVFVEVPLVTFNPVKTVLDLLREEHQPE